MFFSSARRAGQNVTDVRVDTSVRKRELTISVAVTGLTPEKRYCLRGQIWKDGVKLRAFASAVFQAEDLKEGRIEFREK